jgi:hypothetical protein
MHKPLLASILHREAWEWGGNLFPPPHRFPRDDEVEANTEGVGEEGVIGGIYQRTGDPERDRRLVGHSLRQLRRAVDGDLQRGKLRAMAPVL